MLLGSHKVVIAQVEVVLDLLFDLTVVLEQVVHPLFELPLLLHRHLDLLLQPVLILQNLVHTLHEFEVLQLGLLLVQKEVLVQNLHDLENL